MPMTRDEVEALALSLSQASQEYYAGRESQMSDAQYDAQIEVLAAHMSDHPELLTQYGHLLTLVADGQGEGGDVQHTVMMGSMNKVKFNDLLKFVRTVGDQLDPVRQVVAEPKIDGLAFMARYVAGSLQVVATRGTGESGIDRTLAARTLKLLPERVETHSPLQGTFEVRGEVYMPLSNLERASQVRTALGGEPFKNARNAASGIINKGDSAYAGLLNFAVYDIVSHGLFNSTHIERMDIVASLGFTTAHLLVPDLNSRKPLSEKGLVSKYDGYVPADTFERVILTQAAYLLHLRDTIDFAIDGIAFKANLDADRERLGLGSRSPNWSAAYKYRPAETVTTVEGFETSVGQTGQMGIRIKLTPVLVGDVIVSAATGNNPSWIAERDIRVGDTVVLERANDVIPRVDRVVLEQRPENTVAWEPPALDPNGNEWDKTNAAWRSTDPSLSLGASLLHAASRNALDIDGVGTELADALVEAGHTSVVALAELSVDQLARVIVGEIPERTASLSQAQATTIGSVNNDLTFREIGIETLMDLRDARVLDVAELNVGSFQNGNVKTAGKSLAELLIVLADNLVDEGVYDLSALIALTPKELLARELVVKARPRRLGEVVAAKIVQEVSGVIEVPWPRVIYSLAIRSTGRSTSKILAKRYPDLESLRSATFEELVALDDVGEITANSILDGLSQLEKSGVLDGYARLGWTGGQVVESASSALSGQTIVVSGSVPGFTRSTIGEFIESHGGATASSVSKTTTLLVSDPSSSSKYVKAQSLGIQIMGGQEFLDFIASAS